MVCIYGHIDMLGYAQNTWIDAQHYNEESWDLIVATWAAYNFHLAHVIGHLPADKLENTVTIGNSGTYKLGFVASDYVEHLKHHLLQILPDVDLTSGFVDIYEKYPPSVFGQKMAAQIVSHGLGSHFFCLKRLFYIKKNHH